MEGKFNEVFEQFELSLNDYILSRSEKRQLKVEIKDLKLNPSEAQVLKSELKKMAIQKSVTDKTGLNFKKIGGKFTSPENSRQQIIVGVKKKIAIFEVST